MNIYEYANSKIDEIYNSLSERGQLECKTAKALNSDFSKTGHYVAIPRDVAAESSVLITRGYSYEEAYKVGVYLYSIDPYGQLKMKKGTTKTLDPTPVCLIPATYTGLKCNTILIYTEEMVCNEEGSKVFYFKDTELHEPPFREPQEEQPKTFPWDVDGDVHTLDVETAKELLRSYMISLPLKKTSRHSHGGYIKVENAYMQTLTEVASALSLMNKTGELYLPTCFRTEIPLPFGGISTEANEKGETEEDRINMSGCDIIKLDSTMKMNKKATRKGKIIDVKHIPSVCNSKWGSDNAPVELCYETFQGELQLRNKTMWTWNDNNKTDEYLYVMRNTAYHIPKKAMIAAVIKKEAEFKTLFQPGSRAFGNTFKRNRDSSGKMGYKWNIYFTPDELAEMSIRVFDLDPLYGEILSENAYDLLDEIVGLYNASDLRANLAYFADNLIIPEKVRR